MVFEISVYIQAYLTQSQLFISNYVLICFNTLLSFITTKTIMLCLKLFVTFNLGWNLQISDSLCDREQIFDIQRERKHIYSRYCQSIFERAKKHNSILWRDKTVDKQTIKPKYLIFLVNNQLIFLRFTSPININMSSPKGF